MFSLSDVPSTTAILSAYTAFTASAVLVRTVLSELKAMADQLLPGDVLEKLVSKLGGFFSFFISRTTTLVIEENNGLVRNEIFEASEVYLRTKLSPSADRVKICKAAREKSLSFIITRDEKIIDKFEGAEFVWELKLCSPTFDHKRGDDPYYFQSENNPERRSFELSFNKKFGEIAFGSYIPFVLERFKAMKEKNKSVKLALLGNYADGIDLHHPSTFETLAMDPAMKKELIEDLERFVGRRDYYRKVGKAWKRGYLLYGPPGTGKSSLIAAMANYLKFDIYELDLSNLRSNADLQELLPTTRNRSILVIEDVDCGIDLQNRSAAERTRNLFDPNPTQLTLSGILNFIDGLWSCCGDERIIVFTTNYKDRLDPALLRPGRMDVHIHMSYCTPSAFRVLASNYHNLKDHVKFSEIDKLLNEVNATPAEIAEELMKSGHADAALEGVIKFLHKKKSASEEEVVKVEVVASNNKQVEEEDSYIVRRMKRKLKKKGNMVCSTFNRS
ncbi:unnamed protein product [Cuscuta campestris]|uniref:AAA+ ATPase domain-containing protein n=1 Tax=Cuscuta campestris TaxID=132261 RepID=A0A484MWU6_9ASTE|nr:unnamed protein product [Cuscuta campestris]